MDQLWMQIAQMLTWLGKGLDILFSPLFVLHPAIAVAIIALVTVAAAKGFGRYKTKRYQRLETEFLYWYQLRQEAMNAHPDSQKAKQLAQNIDQAKLNQVYYDYFFESFLNSLLTQYIPIFLMFGYIHVFYAPQGLYEKFDRSILFLLTRSDGRPIPIGAPPWFVLWVVLGYLLWFLGKKYYFSRKKGENRSEL